MLRLLAPLLVLLAGCTSLHRYGAARTIPAGSFAMTAALDLVEGREPDVEEPTGDGVWPFAPRVGLRYAPLAGSEIGLDYGGLTGTIDWKQELFRSAVVDVAVDPAVTTGVSAVQGDPLVVAQLPVLVGIHAADWLTVVPQALVGWGHREAEPMTAQTALVGGGLGLYVRLAEWIGLQPLGSMTVELDSGYRYLSGGIGVLVGAQPEGGMQ